MSTGWKAKLRPGSFRGVQFFIDTSEYGGGRAGVTHKFPGRDTPFREDMNRDVRTYKTDAYLVGTNYTVARDQLIAALEAAGSGKLVHPYYGTVTACVEGRFSVSETTKEGGYVKISIPFVEAGSPAFPVATTDTAAALASAAAAAAASNGNFLTSALATANAAQSTLDSVTSKVNNFADVISSNTHQASGLANSIANFAFSVDQLKGSIVAALNEPGLLSQQMQSAIGFLSAALNPSDLITAAQSLFGFGSTDPVIPQTAASSVATQAAFSTINTFVQIMAVTSAASVVTQVPFASYNDAVDLRFLLNDQIDTILENCPNDDLYNALQALQSAVTSALPPPGQDLPSLDALVLSAETNVLSICYELYQSLDLESDVISRNDITNPGFIYAGTTLQVIDANAG
jgi:prophage DNA circulation protein